MATDRGQRAAEWSDEELVARSRRDPALFVHLFDRHAPAVHAYLARRAGSQVAEDLHAEVWLGALGARDRYRDGTPDARPWLYGIARNVLRSHWRRNERRPLPSEPSLDPWPAVEDRLEALEERAALMAAIDSLGDADRDVLLLVAWEGLCPGEVAAALGIPDGTARWRLHRARAHVRAALESTRSDRRDHYEKGVVRWTR